MSRNVVIIAALSLGAGASFISTFAAISAHPIRSTGSGKSGSGIPVQAIGRVSSEDPNVSTVTSPREITTAGFVSNAVSSVRARRCVQIVIAGRGIGRGTLIARTTSMGHNPAPNRDHGILGVNRMPRVTSH